MIPILGIIASSQFTTKTAYESIATVTVGGGGSSTITFSSIPSTFKHLQIRGIAKNTSGVTNPLVKFNGDNATNYAWHQLYGDGASAGASASPTNSGIGFTVLGASQFGIFVMDILDYTSTNKNKTIRALGGFDQNGAGGYVDYNSGVWLNSSNAISSIVLTTGSTSFTQYSSFALYGIKGA